MNSEPSSLPLVSVLMTGYKSNKEYLRLALDSIKAQTYSNKELVFVDDGCDDETITLVRSYSNHFPVNILHNKVNLGLARSLNNGISAAKGEFIARLDDDDIMLPERLAVQINFLTSNPDYSGCWSEYETIDNNGDVTNLSAIGDINFEKQFISKGNCCAHSSLTMRKAVLDELNGYNAKYLYAQDFELYTRLLPNHKMQCLDQCLIQYRINTTRNSAEKKILSYLFAYSAALNYMKIEDRAILRFYMFERTLRLLKFVIFDVPKI